MARPGMLLLLCAMTGAAGCAGTPEDRRIAECATTRAVNEPLAGQGIIEAKVAMAQLYDLGCGVPHQPSYAYLEYLYAAERGHSGAAVGVADFYLGKGLVPVNWDTALFWFAVAERDPGLDPGDRRHIQLSRGNFLNQTLERNGSARLERAEAKASAWTPRTD